MPTSHDVRQQFIDFFVEQCGHQFIPSSPVVPHDDPTLLFANAGMNQFKSYFLGTEEPPDPPRAANTQKCIRAGGKHNDLEDVGKDTYHHTFFEMLGNWSFGDYFKAEAIEWAWKLLVDVWGIEPDRLHATYFEGDAELGLEPDTEARDLWLNLLPEQRVHPGNKKDNFWEMGETGPCGPCSEIHYDGTDDLTGGPKVNQDDPLVIEIWNLVFIQFNRGTDGKLTPLPARHVDTGMGFERIVRVLQGKQSNYDTDVFTPLFDAIREITGARPYDGGEGTLADPVDIAYRVIADHIRCLTFALADGAHCGNTGRNSVLRTILRRAVRVGHQQLGMEEPFFFKLVPAVVEQMGDFFPNIRKNPDAIAEELKEEEESFRRTLDRGITIFDRAVAQLDKGGTLDGETAFDLEATYGFPISLTQLMAEERGLTVDMAGYRQAKEKHAEVSRGEAGEVDVTAHLTEIVQNHDLPETEFIGYDCTEYAGEVTMQCFRIGDLAAVATDRTPFYSEAGGQVGDVGVIRTSDGGFTLHVTDTQKVGGVTFHLGSLEGDPPGGDAPATVELTFEVDSDRRAKIMANHTATHLLNKALRDHVNPEADQKGSLVDDEKLRFDFSNAKAVGEQDVEQVEKTVNELIEADLPVYADFAPIEQGRSIHGLRAVFGEKYPPKVRIVSVGVPVSDLLEKPDNEDWPNYSIEFCGGTHLPKTGDAGGFAILSEEAVSKGVRRITALTGDAATRANELADELMQQVEALKAAPADTLAEGVSALTQEVEQGTLPLVAKRKIREGVTELAAKVKEMEKMRGKEAAAAIVDRARALAEQSEGPIVTAHMGEADNDALRSAIDVLRQKRPDAAILLAGETGGKVAIVASVPKQKIGEGLKAGDWVKEAAKVCGGGGGGRPDMAQAGGKDPSKIDEALEVARDFATAKI